MKQAPPSLHYHADMHTLFVIAPLFKITLLCVGLVVDVILDTKLKERRQIETLKREGDELVCACWHRAVCVLFYFI